MASRSCALSTAPWYDGRGGGQTWCNFPCAVIGWMGCLKHSCGFAHWGTSRHALTHRAQLREAERRTGARERVGVGVCGLCSVRVAVEAWSVFVLQMLTSSHETPARHVGSTTRHSGVAHSPPGERAPARAGPGSGTAEERALLTGHAISRGFKRAARHGHTSHCTVAHRPPPPPRGVWASCVLAPRGCRSSAA